MRPLLLAFLPLSAAAQPFADRSALTPGLANAPAAWGDVNDDGWPDLFCAGTLFLNRQGKAFTAVPVPSAGQGLIADLDRDGRGDLFCFSPIAILRNTGDGPDGLPKFEPLPLPALPPTVCLAGAVADFNLDGFPDFYLPGYEDWEKQITYPSLLLINDRGKTFTLAMTNADRRARGVAACDFDEDGDDDLYVSNYRLQPNTLWINDGRGGLVDQAERRNALATSPGFPGGHSIGACWGDFDGDGRLDLFAGNFAHVDSRGDQPKSRFLRNLGPNPDPVKTWTFDDLHECGVWYQESYASPVAGDFDNDGRLDLFFTTVYADASFGKKNYPVLYRNESPQAPGSAWAFKDVTEGSGLEKLPPTYQAAWADFDRDGKLDLAAGGKLFANASPTKAHWLEVRLVGAARSTRDALGAQVRLKLPDGRTLTRYVAAGVGQGNADSPILHFGLGDAAGPFTLDIRWPGGAASAVTSPADALTTAMQPEKP